MSLEPEQIVQNATMFRALLEKLEDRVPAALALFDTLGENLALCPASSRTQYHAAYPGGLVEHSLRVLSNARALVKTFGHQVDKKSLILSCLFHDIGKVGMIVDDKVVDFYVPQNSQWHYERGEIYKINEALPYMTTSHRSVFLMQQAGITLTHDEWLAIMLNDGFVVSDNKPYALKEPILAHVVMTADYLATMQEKT